MHPFNSLDQDIYAGSIGGLTARSNLQLIDLALCMALMGAYLGTTASELGGVQLVKLDLGGEVRAVPHIDQRVAQAKRRGYTSNFSSDNTRLTHLDTEALPVASITDLTGLIEEK